MKNYILVILVLLSLFASAKVIDDPIGLIKNSDCEVSLGLHPTPITFPMLGGISNVSYTISGVGCNNNLTFSGLPSWITVSTTSTEIIINCTSNFDVPIARSGVFTILYNGVVSGNIAITQEGQPVEICDLTLPGLLPIFPAEGNTESFSYFLSLGSTCDINDFNFVDVPAWATVSITANPNVITVQCQPNTTSLFRQTSIAVQLNGNVLRRFGISQMAPVVFDPPQAVQNDDNFNWVTNESYDLYGNTKSKGKSYFNDLGKQIQSQSVDFKTGRVWASQTMYDNQGRPVFSSLNAPIRDNATFGYSNFVLKNTGNELTTNDIESITSNSSLPNIANEPNTLGWYYSTNNDREPYQDVTSNPWSKAIYSKLTPGATLRTLGGNKIDTDNNGTPDTWLQAYSFSMKAGDELYTSLADNIPSEVRLKFSKIKKITKTVNRDVHGIESVIFTDGDGNTLGAARCGDEESMVLTRDNNVVIGEQQWVDIHISKGAYGGDSSPIEIYLSDGPSNEVGGFTNYNYEVESIYNLITEELVSFTPPTNPSSDIKGIKVILPESGFYRVKISMYENVAYTPITLTHKQNYYDYSFNIYDKTGKLKKSIQPLGLESTFTYNSLNQLLNTTSPDEGTAYFKYRKDGQIRFSQNSKQIVVNEYSYTNYDELGRLLEGGVANGDFSTLIPDSELLQGTNYKEQHFTTYDLAASSLQSILTTYGLPLAAYKQTFLYGNVSKTTTDNPKTNTTYYSYDIYGRVKWLIQKVEGLGAKTIDYQYDPNTGAVTKVSYQKHDKYEKFFHRYTYNAVDQLTKVETSIDDLNYTEQAKYFYYETGALKRTELAENLQGIDYIYNLSGQLKAINDPSITTTLDPGQDGATSNNFNKDVFGLALDYYNGDYTRTSTPTPIQTTPQGVNQFNGNIKATRWQTETMSTVQNAYTYQYNKNNWLQTANFGTANNTTATINFNTANDYGVSNLSYDQNGNILSLNRNGHSNSGTNAMDNFVYHYKSGKNQLSHVEDTNDNSDVNRFDDLKSQEANNYVYNDIGQLETNLQDQINYEYNASGLVTKINGFEQNDTGDWATIYHQDFANAEDTDALPWSVAGGFASIHYGRYYVRGINSSACNELGYYRQSLSISSPQIVLPTGSTVPIVASREVNVIQNKLHQIDLDIIAKQIVQLGLHQITPLPAEVNNRIGYTINIKDSDGTILANTNYNTPPVIIEDADMSSGTCKKFYDQHNTLTFTPTGENITLEIALDHDPALKTTIFVDNIKIQVAAAPKVAFYYDDRGQRIRKETYNQDGLKKAYYVRDAAGSVMGIYDYFVSNNSTVQRAIPNLVEQPIYGASRLGIFYRNSGSFDNPYTYELTDHLGNVRAVIKKSLQKTYPQPADIKGATDYYPFGMQVPDRRIQDADGYRYAYQGQEKDPETGKEAFELRLWDGRIGRWQRPDPMRQYHSPYLGMGNIPSSSFDGNGGYVYIMGANGNLLRVYNKVMGSEIGARALEYFIDNPDSHVIISSASTKGAGGVTSYIGNFEKKGIFSNRLAKRFYKYKIKYKNHYDSFVGAQLQPGENYLISINPKNTTRHFNLESAFHELYTHAYAHSALGVKADQQHLYIGGSDNGRLDNVPNEHPKGPIDKYPIEEFNNSDIMGVQENLIHKKSYVFDFFKMGSLIFTEKVGPATKVETQLGPYLHPDVYKNIDEY